MCEDDMGAGRGVGGRREECALDAVVDDEERCGGGGGAEEDRGEAGVDAAHGLSERESRCLGCGGVACFLEAGFDRVERVEGAVDGEACDGARLRLRYVSVRLTERAVWELRAYE